MTQEQSPDNNYTVEFSEPFEADFDACYLRLSRRSSEAAMRLQNGVLDACFSLARFPRRCSVAPEAEAFGQEVRLLLYRNRKTVYRILYAIFDPSEEASGIVRILRIRQGARWEETESDKG